MTIEWERRRIMSKAPNYYIVDAEALPEIFRKVVDARRMLDTGEAETVNQAVQLAGISQRAFYKYKDAVGPFRICSMAGSSPSRSC